jgi:hypothetical protein
MVEITRWMAGLMGCVLLAGAAFADPTIAAIQGEKRVVLIFTAEARDPYFREQLRFLDAWKGGEERDVVAVRIVGNSVSGAGDSADSLRRRVTPNSRFMIVLLGKDGHVALRSSVPIPASELERTIDAMPMRRAGER